MLSITTHYVKASGKLQPAVILTRGQRAIAMPIEMAFLLDDDDSAAGKAVEYCDQLYGPNNYTLSEVYKVADLLRHSMSDALKMPPPPQELEFDWDRFAERSGLVVRSGDQILLDAR